MKRSPAIELQRSRTASRPRMQWLTEDELWAIHDRVRQHDQQGQEWDKEVAAQIMAAILQLRTGSLAEAPVMLDESDLWQIDRQVPSTQAIGHRQAKDTLLPKVIQAIGSVVRTIRRDIERAPRSSEWRQVARSQ